ncbi:MAG: hypothetical protein E7B29_19990, partial [Mixta calida]|nr:hypothetical protein [Mixta calida]
PAWRPFPRRQRTQTAQVIRNTLTLLAVSVFNKFSLILTKRANKRAPKGTQPAKENCAAEARYSTD